jgi:hypothetical protein
MGEWHCRGWGLERSASSKVGAGRCHRGTTVVIHQESFVTVETGAETGGKPCRREQVRPEQGGSRRGTAGRESAVSAMMSASDARCAMDRSSRRPASELTPWPQLARAGEGARHQAARSTQNAPAKRRFARPDDGFTMTIRTAEGASTGCTR